MHLNDPLKNSADLDTLGVVIVDHGSRRAESNAMLEAFVEMFIAERPEYRIVEPAHMELAEPSIATAVERCVQRGARHVAVCPYFFAPGKHWHKDIPELAKDAAEQAGVPWVVTAPIGLTPLMVDVIDSRLQHCLAHLAGRVDECESCAGMDRCRLHAPQAS
ncbi:MAG: CbiX/SirB N-terminal domain-containing protein [Phycisphaerales bacterium JB063]